MENVNWLSMVIATIIPSIVGFIWYSKALFGRAWMDSIGMTEEKRQSANMPLIMGISLVLSFMLSFFLLNFNNSPADQDSVLFDTFQHGAWHGAFVGLIIIAPVMVSNGLFEQKGWKNILINLGYWVVTLALMGGVLDAMNHWG